MRTHDHESDEAVVRPRSARIDTHPPGHVLRAAAAGRTDVLDGAALLDLQRSVGNSGVGALLNEEERPDERSPVHDVIGSGGTPLAADVREEMQGRLGHDFTDVRVHNDARAHESARSVNAHAYTVGSNVVFQRDRYDPSSAEGKTMLAHELTHVVQQRSGPVDGTAVAGGIKVSDPSDRFEQEAAATAEKVMSVPAASTVGTAGAAAVQREEAPEEEEEPVQGSFVQREAVPEEEDIEA